MNRRSSLDPGQKSRDRGSTFATSRSELKRRGPKRRRQPISAASPAQRAKVRDLPCIVTGKDRHETRIDPMHLCSRAQGGCDDPLCVVPGSAEVHRLFDQGKLDLLPHLIAGRFVAEIQHALGHYGGDLLSLLHRLTGERHWPESAYSEWKAEPDHG